MTSRQPARPLSPSRRNFLAFTGAGAVGSIAAFAGLPVFTAAAAEPVRPSHDPRTPDGQSLRLWYQAPAAPDAMMRQALPIGNGRLGALVGGDPASEMLLVSDASLWTGGRNDVLSDDGQFPYDAVEFGSLTLLTRLTVEVPDHNLDSVTGYQRALDLSNGLTTTSYTRSGVAFRREIYASHPDDVVVLHFSQSGGGTYTGRITLSGTHGETTAPDPSGQASSFAAAFDNGLRYGAAVTAAARGGRIEVHDGVIDFTDCSDLLVVLSGGTDYAPDFARGYRNPSVNPQTLAVQKARAAARHTPEVLRNTHVADYRALFDTMSLSLGASTDQQRSLDTWSRLQARGQAGAAADPELEAAYLQFGRYLMISGSRDGLPMGLQASWIDTNAPGWMGDYHTDVNIEMNYWMPDRTGLPGCFDALTDYCLAQLPSWTDATVRLFNDPRNRFRNSSGKVAGWTVGISTNVYGGSGWQWHPAGSAWLANTLYAHYEYTQDRQLLAKIYPLLKGACEFWEARLLSITVTERTTGQTREVLVDDKDWSPEQGPQDAIGITYAQELVWALFTNFHTASATLGQDAAYRRTIDGLRERLYLPQVSPTTGWLEEWMTPDNLGEVEHRHLSPLIGFFPGDRITVDDSPQDIVTGVRNLLVARGIAPYGWANAWRALCWSRFRDGERAYQMITTNLQSSTGSTSGTALNFFDVWPLDANSSIFQIEANFGTPAAMVDMLLYSQPGRIELLPALPAAWADRGRITGAGARGGFSIDFAWRRGRVTECVVHSTGGGTTQVIANGVTRTVRTRPGKSVTLRW